MIDPVSMTLGWLTGKRIASQRRKKELIGYLYGHVVKEGETPTHIVGGVDYVGALLPNIDEFWTDKETLPWVTITEKLYTSGAAEYICYFTDKKPYMYGGDVMPSIPCVIETHRINFDKNGKTDGWKNNGVDQITQPGVFISTVDTTVYANYKVNGIEFSDPIPVYE
jgi:hypothetical protein